MAAFGSSIPSESCRCHNTRLYQSFLSKCRCAFVEPCPVNQYGDVALHCSEVGLRLLLCPLGSNIVLRTASCSVGVVLPVYSTFKALESRNQNEQQRWLLYWAAYGSFSIAEIFTDKFISWLPLYHHMKLAFLVWLQLPSADGAKQLYMNHLRPFLLRHQARLDQIVGFLYSEMTKFVSANQGALQFAQTLLMKIFGTATQVVGSIFPPLQSKSSRAGRTIGGPTSREEQPRSEIEGPTPLVPNSESENDE